jgi:hypothetical protein
MGASLRAAKGGASAAPTRRAAVVGGALRLGSGPPLRVYGRAGGGEVEGGSGSAPLRTIAAAGRMQALEGIDGGPRRRHNGATAAASQWEALNLG